MKHDHHHAYVHILQLEPLGDSRLNAETFHVYTWPSHVNGSEFDRVVLIEEFSDGSCALYLQANAISRSTTDYLKDKCLQLRKMANPD